MSGVKINMNARYADQCKKLSYLAVKQLNLEKNVKKPHFEELDISIILEKLDEEVLELKEALKSLSDSVSFSKMRSELGDCAAVLAGIIAWSDNKEDSILSDDCA